MYNDRDDIIDISDLYTLEDANADDDTLLQPARPFIHHIRLLGPQGEVVRVKVLIDDGAMVSVMCANLWNVVQHRLGALLPSRRKLRMANGVVVASRGRWIGTIEWGGLKKTGAFEIFPSGGQWSFLLGKPMLALFHALHDYDRTRESITLRDGSVAVTLWNDMGRTHDTASAVHLTLDVKVQHEARSPTETVDAASSSRAPGQAGRTPVRTRAEAGTTDDTACGPAQGLDAPEKTVMDEPAQDTSTVGADTASEREGTETHAAAPTPEAVAAWYIGPDAPPPTDSDPGAEIPDMFGQGDRGIYTRRTDPFSARRVQAIQSLVKVGADLSADQQTRVRALLDEFADCFALSVGEVTPVANAVHRLSIPDGMTFSRKVHQRNLTPPQRAYLGKKIDEMLEAGVIAPCTPDEVKCVSPITLAQKAHEGTGLTLEELQHRVNDQCVAAGMESATDLPPRPPPRDNPTESAAREPKWRICQNFSQINRVTEIAPMPQGDIRMKQRRLSGHRWISTFDFASGFYAVTIAEESRPYTAFYVEGRGYFWCVKMPFGLTGAPSTFAHMTATHLHDMLEDSTMELFVDDGATADDDFEALLGKLRRIFTRVRERGLSLSPSKSAFFVTDTIFAGASVGQKGVLPDVSKLAAIVDWEQPRHAMGLASFLGLAAYFRDLIKGYATIEGPLRDLVKAAEPPKDSSKAAYRRALQAYTLGPERWKEQHTEAFLTIKRILTSEPVLRCPRWDGSPFIVTSDGCKDGFGGVLMQRFQTVLTEGNTVTRLHPVAFASKRTSRAERRYMPYMLEFAALKFALDKFSDIIWGYPVEVETDCSALRYVLTNDKLNATYARWRDGVLAYTIVDVRHIRGENNVVSDGISRQGEGREHKAGDGSDWSVAADWETRQGLVNDLLLVQNSAADDSQRLRQRFAAEPLFLQVINALMDTEDVGLDERVRARARHRAKQYLIDDGRLWKLGGGAPSRARARVECMTRAEAKLEAARVHATGGHWGRDIVKLALMDRIWSPRLDQSIMEVIHDCGHCKNFGGAHLHALLDPITRRHPFELLVGDYLTLPHGKGGYYTVLLLIDVFAQHVWGFRFKKAGTGTTTIQGLRHVWTNFVVHETFMADGGSHFNNKEVRQFCRERGSKLHTVAAYSPWINGLVEGTNKLLIHILKRWCAPDLNEEELSASAVPKQWPDHFDRAIEALNSRVLPALKHSPKELLFGIPINTPATPAAVAASAVTAAEVDVHLAYAAQQRLDGYDQTVRHAEQRKARFDKRVHKSRAGEVRFGLGDLVQVRRSDLDHTLSAERKLAPNWSVPRRVTGSTGNSYTLESLENKALDGLFNARRLRRFIPHPESKLAMAEGQRSAELQQITAGELN